MARTTTLEDLMERSGVRFGTSGARGLVTAMTDEICFAYTTSFLEFLCEQKAIAPGSPVAVAGDRRASTPRIKRAVAEAIRHTGLTVVDCGPLPTPAVALYGLTQSIPAIMVTGSHIPADRNGIKFYKPTGELLKSDEAALRARSFTIPEIFDEHGAFRNLPVSTEVFLDAAQLYRRRYLEAFGPRALEGATIGLYGHSAVGREIIGTILRDLGAEVLELGFCDAFVSVDTEAVRLEDIELAHSWAREHELDAIVSTDGDSDRPLVSDERGEWLRGDVVGIIVARYLGANTVVTPVSSNTALEASGAFERVLRTKIGSPYVIDAMHEATAPGARVVGYEANGGFLTATALQADAGLLHPLPTRDAVIVMLGVLLAARKRGVPVSALADTLPPRFTASDRLEDFPPEQAQARLQDLRSAGPEAMAGLFEGALGSVVGVDETDGLRMSFESGEIVHLRPSGNAPELRCYTEADSPARATELVVLTLELLDGWRS